MTDLLPQIRKQNDKDSDIEMGNVGNIDPNMKQFYDNVAIIKGKLTQIDKLIEQVKDKQDSTKTVTKSEIIQKQRAQMQSDLTQISNIAKQIKTHIDKLKEEGQAALQKPGQGPGSSNERTRTSIVSGLAKSLKSRMNAFNDLREKMQQEQQDLVGRRVQAVTGQKPTQEDIERIIDNGENDTFYQQAIQTAGRLRAEDTLAEIRERNEAVRELERMLLDLQEVFRDMAVLVEEQGRMVDDIQANVGRAKDHVDGGVRKLISAKASARSTRRWIIAAVVVIIVIIAVVVGAVVGYNKLQQQRLIQQTQPQQQAPAPAPSSSAPTSNNG